MELLVLIVFIAAVLVLAVLIYSHHKNTAYQNSQHEGFVFGIDVEKESSIRL